MFHRRTSGPGFRDKKQSSEGAKPDEENKEQSVKAKSDSTSFLGLFRFASASDCFLVPIGCLCAAANGGTMSAYAVLMGHIFDTINSSAGLDYTYIYYLIGLGVAVIFAGFGQVFFLNTTADRTTTTVRKTYLKALLQQDVAFFDASRSGQLSTAIVENSIVFRESIGEKLGQLVQHSSTFVIGICVGFYFLWKLALVTLSLSPLLGIAGFFMSKTNRQRVSAQLQSYAEAGAIAEETLTNVRTITSLGAQPLRIEKFKKELAISTKISVKQGILGGFATGLVMFIFFSSYGISFYAGGSFIVTSRNDAESTYPLSAVQNVTAPNFCAINAAVPAQCNGNVIPPPGTNFLTAADVCACSACGCGCYPNKQVFGPSASANCVTGGNILTVFLSVLLGAFGLGQAGPAISALNNGRVAAKRIYNLIDQEPSIKNAKDGVKMDRIQGNIRFNGVAFTYPTRPDKAILKNLNLSINAGTRVGLVGPSGSGKSTITQLLLRFYDPSLGTVTVDGVDIKTMDMTWFRSNIGLISQEPILFATSIKENVRFGLPGATDEQVIEACKAANAYDFIQDFPDKLDTFVGGAGSSQLSGGQKQRICLARAFIRKPSILIADEATSALDTKSEAIVNASIDGFSSSKDGKRCTTIVIAHRLDTIRRCDKIIVLEYGVVVEEGTHDELVVRGGTYAALVRISEKAPDERPGHAVAVPVHEDKATLQLMDEKHVEVIIEDEESKGDGKAVALVAPKSSAVSESTSAAESGPKKGANVVKKRVPLSRVFQFAYPDRFMFIPALGGAALVGLVFPVFALIFANILSTFYLPISSEMLYQCGMWALTFFGLACGMLISSTTQGGSFGIINGRMTSRVRQQTFEAVLRSEPGFFDDPKNAVGVLTAKLASDASLVKAALSDRSSLMVQDTSTLIAGLTIAFVGSWKMALVVFAVFPLMIFGGIMQAKSMSGVNLASNANLAEANQTVSEAVGGIRTVIAFDLMDAIQNVYSAQLKNALKGSKKNASVAGFGFGFGQSQRFFVYALALWYGSTLIKAQEITFKDLNQAMFGILMSAIALGQAMAAAPDVAKGKPAVESIFSILDRPSPIDWTSSEGEQPSQVMGDIAFENVTFSYPTRPGVFALEHFSLKIPRGKTFALVGPSGSGKSTVVAMIERFYDPLAGTVKLDGIDLRQLNVAWLRASIGLVSQEPILMNESIMENIRYGKPDATDEECIQACKDANCHTFIEGLPQQYETSCGNRGGQLSGGQKQRISIARALVRKPKILLLDESTSALDEESQKVVQDALDRLLESQVRTTIIIAHRFSTIRNADTIVVVDHGRVVEQGTFNELAANETGVFAALLRSQHS